jgi:hypothetical protein
MSELLRDFTQADQQSEYLQALLKESTGPDGIVFRTKPGEQYTLRSDRPPVIDRNRLVFTSEPDGPDSVRLSHTRGEGATIQSVAREARVRVLPSNEDNRMAVSIDQIDVVVRIGETESAKENWARNFDVPMPAEIQAIRHRTANQYMKRDDLPADQKRNLLRSLTKQNNSVESEMHSRVSFALSCLVLTMVGYGLGVRFKSGNYLTAFAVSVVPALLSIVLVVTGQHICENIPPDYATTLRNPLQFGLITIWTGNAIVLAIAVGLLVKLRRT